MQALRLGKTRAVGTGRGNAAGEWAEACSRRGWAVLAPGLGLCRGANGEHLAGICRAAILGKCPPNAPDVLRKPGGTPAKPWRGWRQDVSLPAEESGQAGRQGWSFEGKGRRAEKQEWRVEDNQLLAMCLSVASKGAAATRGRKTGGGRKIMRREEDLYGNMLYFRERICINGFKTKK